MIKHVRIYSYCLNVCFMFVRLFYKWFIKLHLSFLGIRSCLFRWMLFHFTSSPSVRSFDFKVLIKHCVPVQDSVCSDCNTVFPNKGRPRMRGGAKITNSPRHSSFLPTLTFGVRQLSGHWLFYFIPYLYNRR